MAQRKKQNNFIVMWCNNGLECIIPIKDVAEVRMTKIEKLLTGDEDTETAYEKEIGKILFMLDLRAKSNTQRHYEIYNVSTEHSITKTILENMFEDSPQMIVDLIREKGHKIYSNRSASKVLIS